MFQRKISSFYRLVDREQEDSQGVEGDLGVEGLNKKEKDP